MWASLLTKMLTVSCYVECSLSCLICPYFTLYLLDVFSDSAISVLPVKDKLTQQTLQMVSELTNPGFHPRTLPRTTAQTTKTQTPISMLPVKDKLTQQTLQVVSEQMVSVANSVEKLTMLVTAVRTEGVKTSSMLNSNPGLIDSKLEASQATTDFQLSELAAALKGSLVDITEQLAQTVVSTAAPATNISSAGPSQLPASFAAAAASPKPVTHRPAPFLHASASPALDAAILNASFALRTNTQTARQVLEQYGVQALLANIEYLTEADRTDDVLIEAIASASGPPLDGVSPSPSPSLASGSRPPFLAASESLADAVLPPSGPRLSLGSANPKSSLASAGLLCPKGKQAFKVNLTPPPRFGLISNTSNVASWLKNVAKVCRLSGYGVDAWSTFASTLLDGIPRELFDAAESVAESQGLAHVQAFLDWDNFTTWCTVNLNVADHVDQARSAIASLQQTGTVAAYKSAFNILLARLGADNASAGQQVF